ncbi:MAG: hypothetical protein JNN08_21015 [Bryobacterales bacterium]|nr:hypothetical protein [Bryobacterales bacterium]
MESLWSRWMNRTSPLVRRFQESMEIDYRKWHDGIGYDIGIIRKASEEERSQIEAILVARGVRDWRDVEALVAVGSERATKLVKEAVQSRDHSVSIAVLEHAGHLVAPQERSAALVAAFERAELGSGLAEALRHVRKFHPPEVIDALLRGIIHREEYAPLFAGAVLHLHSRGKAGFDSDLRPLASTFRGDARKTSFRTLCTKIGANADLYLQ